MGDRKDGEERRKRGSDGGWERELLVVLECLKDCAFDSADCLCSFAIMPLARAVVEC